MGIAIDTAAYFAVNPGAAGAAVTAATGDSNRVREFSPQSKAWIEQVIRKGAASGFVQIVSPVMHDAVRGLRVLTAETPSRYLTPREVGEPMQPGDTLAITLSGGTAETDIVVVQYYYMDLLGISARLFGHADILGNIEHLKVLQVAVTTNATAGQWQDTVITTTEDLLKADRKYAVLGYVTDVALGAICVKGSETGNLRVGGPGMTNTDDTSNFFIDEAVRNNVPFIPVISANNKGSLFVSTVTDGTAVTANVQLILGALPPSFQ